jgi:hypothetical protein
VPSRTGSRGRGLWIAGGFAVALAAAVGVTVLVMSQRESRPPAVAAATPAPTTPAPAAATPTPTPPVATPATPAPPNAMVAPPDATPAEPLSPVDPVKPVHHEPAKPHVAATPMSDKMREFERLATTRHCMAATMMMRELAPTSELSKKLQECQQGQSKAFSNYMDPSSEPWVRAYSEDLAATGKTDLAEKQLDGYYYSRAINACRNKDAADAKASIAKVKSAQYRDLAPRTCKALGTPLD